MTPPRGGVREDRSTSGVFCGLSAFLIWGLSPVYWKALGTVPAFEIIMHRIVWSFVFLSVVMLYQRRIAEIADVFKNWRVFGVLLTTTVLVSCNWFIFVWAINHGRILETSLGYYVTPLVNVLLGVVFLQERLRFLQVMAVLLAALAVGYLIFQFGALPWVALGLALTFSFYGLLRKMIATGALVGLTVETLLLSIPAGVYLLALNMGGTGAFLRQGGTIGTLLVGTALVTGLPLLLFTIGARRLNLATIGFLQFIAPTCTFVLGVVVYQEPFSSHRLTAFVLIWIALGLYSLDSLRQYHKSL
jgi:chloramphenicol-sensitive protein RarD